MFEVLCILFFVILFYTFRGEIFKNIYYLNLKIKNYLSEREINSTSKINIILREEENILIFYIGDRLISTNLKKTCIGDGIKIGKHYYNTFKIIVPEVEKISSNDF